MFEIKSLLGLLAVGVEEFDRATDTLLTKAETVRDEVREWAIAGHDFGYEGGRGNCKPNRT